MEKKSLYRILLVLVIFLAVIYTLGVIGLIPFKWSYYITIFMIVLFFYLKLEDRLGRT
ncbi:hypothetical protein [Thermococcus sp.]|uniref:hypothetical protein n=1 Tax=Thermococcus sp. TaxID=35749 RepID=UPI00261AAA19|nr:hypothetical protein [Thermococcus sp.]